MEDGGGQDADIFVAVLGQLLIARNGLLRLVPGAFGRLHIGAAVGIPLLAQGLGRLMGLVLDGALLLNRSHAFGIVAVRSKGHRDHGHGQRHTQ